MPKIQVLDKHTAELIAAGEVVERPMSVVKELMENAIDAGATRISVEIESGGIRRIRITDNGCGMAREDVPTAFLRHATSKVRTERDLESIGTLGFRGEALASIAAVSRVEILTARAEDEAGTRYVVEGGEGGEPEDCGCPVGTTLTVSDLFYNVPARMKFLKKDVGEANAVAGVVDRIALSHPEISVRFIRDGREELLTPGDGKLRSAAYAVLGKEMASSLIETAYTLNGIRVTGLIAKPEVARANRLLQYFFVNGRYVKTKTGAAALEQAYKGRLMTGRFPAALLYLTMPTETVDVNVHPAKIEIRFVNERPVFEAVYYAVKMALTEGETIREASIPAPKEQAVPPKDTVTYAKEVSTPLRGAEEYFSSLPTDNRSAEGRLTFSSSQRKMPVFERPERSYTPVTSVPDIVADDELIVQPPLPMTETPLPKTVENETIIPSETASQEVFSEEDPVTVVGEAFDTYIIACKGDKLYFIDKHAAHERLLYNRLRQEEHTDRQLLLEPQTVSFDKESYAVLEEHRELLEQAGFETEEFGNGSLLVRAVPMMLSDQDASAVLQEIAGGLASGKREIVTDRLEWIYHSVACRAAVKAGDVSTPPERLALAKRVLNDNDIRHCPHGRPVCFSISKHELEKQLGRLG